MQVTKSLAGTETSKHARVRGRVMELAGELGPGGKLPPERLLSQEFGIARETLRRSLDALAREGLVERRRGAGTFVARPRITKQFRITSFTEDMRHRGMVASSYVVDSALRPAGPRVAKHLQVSPAVEVLVVQRVRLADGNPMALETIHTPRSLVPDLRGEDLGDASFYETLRSRYGIVVAAAHQTIEATVTDEAESALLEVPHLSPALFITRVTKTADGSIVEYVRSIFRGDRYTFAVESEASPSLAGFVRS